MKKIITLTLSILLLFSCNNDNSDDTLEEQACDNGTFVGNVTLNSQEEVNEFGEMCYTKIDGTLKIGDFFNYGLNDITDLTPLSNLTEIFVTDPNIATGNLSVNANVLPSLQGLHNITSVTGLSIHKCFELTDLNGLNGLIQIGGYSTLISRLQIGSNDNLLNIDDLSNLVTLGHITDTTFVDISGNHKLMNLDGLSNLANVEGKFFFNTVNQFSCGIACDGIEGNIELNDFCGVQNLFQTGDYIEDWVNIQLNEYNPTAQDIINGNCSQ